MWKCDGGFTKTETIKQLQSFVTLPDQLFTRCLLFYMRSKPFYIFSRKGHVWSSFYHLFGLFCPLRTLEGDSSILC